MKVFITPNYRHDDKGDGGIRRVTEAQIKYLPEYGIELVDKAEDADVVNVHATEVVDHPNVVLSCHGLYWTEDDWGDIKWVKNANNLLIEGFRTAQHVTAPSRWVANVLQRGMLVNPTVIGHGINVSEWKPAQSRGYILYNKNREDPSCRSEAVNVLAERFPREKFVSTFGRATENVNVIGRVPYKMMKDYVQQSSVYLSFARETFGTGMLEALASGVPVLSWDYGGASEIITHKEHGYLARPGDYDDLQAGLEYCLRYRNDLGSNGRQLVMDQYQWKDVIARYVSVYQQVYERKHEVKVSIVVPSYNLGEYLPDAIESVRSQPFQDWEMVIVNDASTDNTLEVAKRAAENDSRIRVISNPTNLHVSDSRNIGLKCARGQYLMSLDADDMLGPDALGILVKIMDADKSIQIACGSMEVFGANENPFVSEWPPKDISYKSQISKQNQLPYSALYRREVFERTGGYRRRIRTGVEDADFWTRALSYGFRAKKVTNKVTLKYRMRNDSLSHTKRGENWLRWYPWSKDDRLTPFGATDIEKPFISSLNPVQISVIVPVGPEHDIYLQDCLDSLLAQTFRYWEVIVINDTGHAISLDGFPFARLYDTEGRQGAGVARNVGLDHAQGKYVVFLDADDYAQPNMLSTLYRAITSVGGYVYPDWYADNGKEIYPDKGQDWDYTRLPNKMLGPITAIYSKSDLDVIGGFDESMVGWEDWDLHLSLLDAGICGTRLAEPLFTYRYKTGTRREDSVLQHKDNLLDYIKNKHTKLYRGDSLMACGKCGSGGGKKSIIPQVASSKSVSGVDDMVLVEYIGAEPQSRHIKSKASKGDTYTFGAGKKELYVHRADLPWLESLNLFRQKVNYESPVVATEDIALETVRVEFTPPTNVDVPLEALPFDVDLMNYLKGAGYDTRNQIRLASDAALASIKGIGPKRLKVIREATG